MATKRSPSPAIDTPSDTPNRKEPRVDRTAQAQSADAQARTSSARPTPTPSGGGAHDAGSEPSQSDPPPSGQAGSQAQDKKRKRRDGRTSDVDQEGSRATRLRELDFKTVHELYQQGTLRPLPDPNEFLYPPSAELNDKIVLWQGDITTLPVDCIVNAANKSLLGGGGVDGAIHRAAGPGLLEECRTLKGCKTGETKLTGSHRLQAKHVAHTVGPVYSRRRKQECEDKLRSCYRSTLELCVQHDIKTIAFSGISTGIYGYPLEAAAEVACDEVRKFLNGEDGKKIDKVIFCVFRHVDLSSYLDSLPAFFPSVPEQAEREASPTAQAGAGEKGT